MDMNEKPFLLSVLENPSGHLFYAHLNNGKSVHDAAELRLFLHEQMEGKTWRALPR